jgi:hypothetical protein
MLRLVLLASLSLVPGCSCDALWQSYEIPCGPDFPCLDGGTGAPVDLSGQISPIGNDGSLSANGDMSTSISSTDMRPPDLRPPDMHPTDMHPMDMRSMDMHSTDMLIVQVPDIGVLPHDASITEFDLGTIIGTDLGLKLAEPQVTP